MCIARVLGQATHWGQVCINFILAFAWSFALRIVRGQAKILVVVTFERHLAYLRTMKLAQYTYHIKGEEMFF